MLALILSCMTATSTAVLGLDQAVESALRHQPAIRQARAAALGGVARAREAESPLWPQVSANAAYSQSTANFAARPGALPESLLFQEGGSGATHGFWTLGVSAQQLLWDFGQTLDHWRSQVALAESSKEDERAERLLVVLNARTAFFNARATRDIVRVNKDTVANQVKHLEQIRGFVEVGTRPEIDLAQARTDRANAEVALIQAENDYETAKAQLNQAMGIEGPTDYEVSDDTLPPIPDEDGEAKALVRAALAERPELRSLGEQIRSARLALQSIAGTYWPSIGVSTGMSDNGANLNPHLGGLIWNWNGQVALSWALFQGFLTPAEVDEAESKLDGLEAQKDALRLSVRLEVDQARLALRAAKATRFAAGEALANAQDRLRLAEGRYQTGVGNVIELGDAQVALTNAAAQVVRADYNLSTARAQLTKALGRP